MIVVKVRDEEPVRIAKTAMAMTRTVYLSLPPDR